MTDSSENKGKNRPSVDGEAFARFLELLPADAGEAAQRYPRLHEKLVGFFRMKGISDPMSAADETIDRAVIKIAQGTPVPDAGKYCLGIARNVAKERYRRAQREISAFLELIANLPDATDEQVERIHRVLEPCFKQLAIQDQHLLAEYCQDLRGRARAEHRRQLAETMNTTVLALRMRVTRLRSDLTLCVKKLSNDG